jgi:CubicO group peptidase (beta-lactamase class C family)
VNFPKTINLIEQGLSDRLHVGGQLFISRDNETLIDHATGIARDGVPMTPDHLHIWMSCTKPVAAVAIGQLWERGQLGLDDTVAAHIPEFGDKGKKTVTLRHLLTHTGGFRAVANSWKPAPAEQFLSDIYAARLEPGWTPGKKAGYHVASSWYVLGEIVRRISGRPFEQYVRDEIFGPLNMPDCWIGMPPDTYDAYGDRIALMYTTDTSDPMPHPLWSLKDNATMCRPAANGYGPARQFARFYQALLNKGTLDGTRLLQPQTVEALIARHRTGMYDHTFRHNIDWCLGFIPNNNIYGWETLPYGYGPHAGARAFGHGGHQTSVGMADPDNGLAIVLIFNGAPGDARHNARIRATMGAIYEDLGLAPDAVTDARSPA